MSIDFEREVRDALRSAADPLRSPPVDLAAVRQAGRRRRIRSIAVAAFAVIVAAGAVIGVLQFAASPGHPTRPVPAATAAMTNVRAFYSRYEAASRQGEAAVDALIRARVASWYVPILEAPGIPGVSAVECGHPSDRAGLYYQRAGEVAGQSVILVGSRLGHSLNPGLSIVIEDQATGKITGISCVIAASDVTALGAQNAAKSLYGIYIRSRRHGTSVRRVLTWLTGNGPTTGSLYLLQADRAMTSRSLTYDPVVCTPDLIPDVTVGRATTIADGSAGLVAITPRHAAPILAVVVLGAKGWTVSDIACPHP